jgi:TnpA family transposase
LERWSAGALGQMTLGTLTPQCPSAPSPQCPVPNHRDEKTVYHHFSNLLKYATALRLGTAEADAILKRFSRNRPQHPTYRALAELGKAVKTIFLCHYIASEELRREINQGLNVIESWNSANDFILLGKGRQISSNLLLAQELTVLSMHLLQTSLVHINTLMIQRVFAQTNWTQRMTEADWRGLTPLFYHHINPYGTFELNLEQRLPNLEEETDEN